MLRDQVKADIRALAYRTVENWETRVYFRGTIRNDSDGVALNVRPYGSGADLWTLVSGGAQPHTIRPVRAKALVFQEGYIPATEPGWIGSRRKKRYGNWRAAREVNHPGFEGREFEKEIAERYEPRFKLKMLQAQNNYIRRQARDLIATVEI